MKSWQHRLADDEAQEDQQHPETSVASLTLEQRDLGGTIVTLKIPETSNTSNNSNALNTSNASNHFGMKMCFQVTLSEFFKSLLMPRHVVPRSRRS